MAFPDRGSSRSLKWAGIGAAVVLISLVIVLHEQQAHDACIAALHLPGKRVVPRPDNCGFADTTFWAGMLLLVTGSLFTLGAASTAITTSRWWIHPPSGPTRKIKSPKRPGDRAPDSSQPVATGLGGGRFAVAPFEPPAREPTEMPETDQIPDSQALKTVKHQTPPRYGAPPAPSWYSDPDQPDAIRWWDGSSWGESRLRPR
jgi:hypothetical protein